MSANPDHGAPGPSSTTSGPPAGPERAIGRVLLIGTRAAALVMLAGLIFVLVRGGERADLSVFRPVEPGLRSITGVARGLAQGDPRSLLLAGVLLLVLTPACRCVAALLHYARWGDRIYTAIALFVLAALLLGMLGVVTH